MPPEAPLRIPLHYDFASTLCYVTQRAVPRFADRVRNVELGFDWRPLDLAQLLGWRRGAAIDERRRANALRVARELEVSVRVPTHWIDSRRALAVTLTLGDGGREASWRERVFSAVFEEGRPIDTLAELAPLARELGFELDAEAVEAKLDTLHALTEAARDVEITGVPTFMLGSWPLGGIQSDETMCLILEHWTRKQP